MLLPRLLTSLCLSSLVVSHAYAQPGPPAPLAPPQPLPPPAAQPAPAPGPPPAPGAAPTATEAYPVRVEAAPESLETPYSDVVPPQPAAQQPAAPAPPTRVVVPPLPGSDIRPLGPIRAQRRLALTAELGWNGLSSFGPVLTYYVHPRVGLDLGTGLSLFGWKVGVRGRYNFLTSNFTPFVGAGFNATSGLGELPFTDKNDPDYDPDTALTIDVKPSYLMQGVVGFDYMHRRGFTMIGAIGYARLLNQNNVKIVAGEPKDDEQMAIDVLFKSGAVISMSFGYAWE